MATVVSGSFTGQATGGTVVPLNSGNGAYTLSGTWVATVLLERTFDGSLWLEVDSNTSNIEKDFTTPGGDVEYRLRCSAFTSGDVVWSLAVPKEVATFAQSSATTKFSPWFGKY